MHQNVTVYTGLWEATWTVLFWCLLSQIKVIHWSTSAVITSILIMFTYSHWMLNLNFTVCSRMAFGISILKSSGHYTTVSENITWSTLHFHVPLNHHRRRSYLMEHLFQRLPTKIDTNDSNFRRQTNKNHTICFNITNTIGVCYKRN